MFWRGWILPPMPITIPLATDKLNGLSMELDRVPGLDLFALF